MAAGGVWSSWQEHGLFPQIYFHLNNVFELMSKAVVESKQKVNIPKLSKEEPEEKEENEKAKREEERGDHETKTLCLEFVLKNLK